MSMDVHVWHLSGGRRHILDGPDLFLELRPVGIKILERRWAELLKIIEHRTTHRRLARLGDSDHDCVHQEGGTCDRVWQADDSFVAGRSPLT